MSHLVIHVGQHKTGTTSAQASLAQSRDILEDHGLIYPPTPNTTGHHALAGRAEYLPEFFFAAGEPEELWQDIVEQHAGSDRTVLISSETFLEYLGSERHETFDSSPFIDAFDKVTVIAILRQPLDLIEASYVSSRKRSFASPCAEAIERSVNIGPAKAQGPDLALHVNEMFCGADFICTSYEPLRAIPNGVLDFILAQTGADVRASDLSLDQETWLNVSPQPLATYMAKTISDSPAALDAELIGYAQEALEQHHGQFAGTTCFTRAEILKYAPILKKRREDLRHALGNTTQLDAFRIPDYTSFLHREDVTPGTWAAFARVLNRVRLSQ